MHQQHCNITVPYNTFMPSDCMLILSCSVSKSETHQNSNSLSVKKKKSERCFHQNLQKNTRRVFILQPETLKNTEQASSPPPGKQSKSVRRRGDEKQKHQRLIITPSPLKNHTAVSSSTSQSS